MLLVLGMEIQSAKADTIRNQEKLLVFSSSEKALTEELDNARGREGVDTTTIVNLQNVKAILKDNQAINNVNGSNIITGGSFNGASGMTSVIQNSGNNVIIQDSTIISVTIMP